MAEFVMPGLPKYGAVELKEVHRKYMTIALAVASGFWMAMLGAYKGSQLLTIERPPDRIIKIVKYSELGPPPSLANTDVAPAVTMAAQAATGDFSAGSVVKGPTVTKPPSVLVMVRVTGWPLVSSGMTMPRRYLAPGPPQFNHGVGVVVSSGHGSKIHWMDSGNQRHSTASRGSIRTRWDTNGVKG